MPNTKHPFTQEDIVAQLDTQNTMTDQIKRQMNNLRKQIHQYQNREKQLRKFLRLLNSSEDNVLTDEAHAKFVELCDEYIPNG
tara:strand:+ start:1427 stop:1675 length:249 start_codon:yes stop_codon:yes gene_type:complete